jgi:hypothetical protein
MAAAALVLAVTAARAESLPATLEPLVRKTCGDCHAGGAAEGGLDLDAVSFDLGAAAVRDHFAVMHDRVAKGQMPPDPADLPEAVRKELLATLSATLTRSRTASPSKVSPKIMRSPLRAMLWRVTYTAFSISSSRCTGSLVRYSRFMNGSSTAGCVGVALMFAKYACIFSSLSGLGAWCIFNHV